MFIEFRVSNYRSIAEEQILSFVPNLKQKEYPDNIYHSSGINALSLIAIYGSNAAGKSNLLKAMSLMDRMLHISAKGSSVTKLPYDPFRLKDSWENQPTSFEITFLLEGIRYRFGFSYNNSAIVNEWLFRKKKGREVSLFEREGEIIEVSSGLEGNNKLIDAAIEATRDNALFLSTLDMLNVKEAKEIFKWFGSFHTIDGLSPDEVTTVGLWTEKNYQEEVKEFLARFNLGLLDLNIETKEFDIDELPLEVRDVFRKKLAETPKDTLAFSISATHKKYDTNSSPSQVTWSFNERESAGTIQMLQLSGPIIYALKNGGVLIIDEIESKLHSTILLDLVDLFLNPLTNPNKTQLIFATHDTNLLNYAKLRRDQIYFVEKNDYEATEIYTLSDFKYITSNQKDRIDANKEKRYLEGRYGAIPFITDVFKISQNG